MAIRRLIHFRDVTFRRKSKEIVKFDERLWQLLDDMRDTLTEIDGVGCAAVHVGVLRRAVVVINDETNEVIELINPVITDRGTKTDRVLESSVAPGAPGALVVRPKKIIVEAVDRNGKPITVTGEGFLAATLCHEIDHLDGIIFTDRAIEIITK